MTRLGVALGARPDTFMGLSGMGDLVLAATGHLSRNRRVGLLLAQGQSLQQAVDSLGHVAEAPVPWPRVRRGPGWTCPLPRQWWRCSMAAWHPPMPWGC